MLKHNAELALKLSLIAGILATLVSSWQNYGAYGSVSLHSIANGLVDGFLIVGLLSTYKLIVTDVLLRRFFQKLGFLPTLLLNSFVYSVLILFGRAFGRYLMEYDRFVLFPIGDGMAKQHFFEAVIVAVVFSVVFNFLLQNGRLLGPKVMANFITGRYHRPRSETRVVLFMDLKSSTTIAEKLGDKIYLEFMSEAFADMTEAIISRRAEIYKYVGDEIILTWSLSRGIADNNCLKFPLEIQRLFVASAGRYQSRYGHIPQFRTGIHVGDLVIGEVGVLKREIALIGDVMNTTARIAGHCRECGHDLLISKDLLEKLAGDPDLNVIPLGTVALRGKIAGAELFAVKSVFS